jgi:hypothetical protein
VPVGRGTRRPCRCAFEVPGRTSLIKYRGTQCIHRSWRLVPPAQVQTLNPPSPRGALRRAGVWRRHLSDTPAPVGVASVPFGRFLSRDLLLTEQRAGRERRHMAAESSGAVESSPSALPRSVLLTFLIADVRGYTRFTVEQGDDAAARLADRFATLADGVVGSYGGRVLELRGDEALCVFPSARDALRAAVSLQTAFRESMASAVPSSTTSASHPAPAGGAGTVPGAGRSSGRRPGAEQSGQRCRAPRAVRAGNVLLRGELGRLAGGR